MKIPPKSGSRYGSSSAQAQIGRPLASKPPAFTSSDSSTPWAPASRIGCEVSSPEPASRTVPKLCRRSPASRRPQQPAPARRLGRAELLPRDLRKLQRLAVPFLDARPQEHVAVLVANLLNRKIEPGSVVIQNDGRHLKLRLGGAADLDLRRPRRKAIQDHVVARRSQRRPSIHRARDQSRQPRSAARRIIGPRQPFLALKTGNSHRFSPSAGLASLCGQVQSPASVECLELHAGARLEIRRASQIRVHQGPQQARPIAIGAPSQEKIGAPAVAVAAEQIGGVIVPHDESDIVRGGPETRRRGSRYWKLKTRSNLPPDERSPHRATPPLRESPRPPARHRGLSGRTERRAYIHVRAQFEDTGRSGARCSDR